MNDYDIDILKKNIKIEMNNKHITQTMLSNDTGIPQPTISNVLSHKNSNCFTISQLVKIAKALQVTTDSLLGLTNVSKPQKDFTMADICSKLFEIDKIEDIKIGYCKTGEYIEIDDFTHEQEEVEVPGIYFSNDVLKGFLKEWADIKAVTTSNHNTKTKLTELWKSEITKNTRERRQDWHFRNRLEQGRYLAELLVGGYDTFLYIDSERNESIELLKEYMDSIAYAFDFDEKEQDILSSRLQDIL